MAHMLRINPDQIT